MLSLLFLDKTKRALITCGVNNYWVISKAQMDIKLVSTAGTNRTVGFCCWQQHWHGKDPYLQEKKGKKGGDLIFFK